ncbi:MAG: hypothetical protein LAO05_02645 [Acidobacteriia bacterium]|nr:hypothetical protein [Terriglobia bacterium]
MKKALIATVCIALTAGTALATVPVTDQFLPALGHALGQLDPITSTRPHWQGDVWIFNPSTTQSATVTIYLLLRQANPNPTSQVVTVGSGDTVYLPDVILGTFGNNNLFAGLRFVSTIPVLVTGESYDANATIVNKPTGTTGQFFAALPAGIALGVGDSSDLPGFDQDGINTAGLFRSNLAVVETTGNPVSYTVSVYNGSGTLVGSKSYSLGVLEVGQINNVITDVTGSTASNERVHIAVTGGTGRLVAVGSRVDNRTNDPSTIDMVNIHNWGRFEGIVEDPTGQLSVGGGIQLQISNQVLTSYDAGTVLCGGSTTADVSPDSTPTNIPIAANHTFSFQVIIPYTDGQTTLFTTTWTLSGARAFDGIWSGTLSGTTTGGTGLNASCNGVVTSNWRAAWTGTGTS